MEKRQDRCKMRWSLFFLAGFFLHAVDCLTEKEKEKEKEKETLFRHPTQFTGEGREHKELPEDYWKIHSSPPTPIWLGQPHHHHYPSPKSLLFNRRRRRRQADEDGKWPKEKIEDQPTLFNDKDDYDSFFRNEYYRILAQSFASSRKKREVRKRVEEAKIMDHLSSSQQKLNHVEKRATKKHKSVAMHIGSNDKENLQNEYASEETGIVQPKNAGFRPLPGFSAHPVSNSDLPFGKWKFFDDEKYEQECPPLHLLAKECSTLGEIMPEGNLKNILLRACNWLEICYSCGNDNGLQPDDCDTGFLYGIRFVCEGDVPCQATGRLLLLSLRQTGASQRSLSSICNADQCIEQFLLQPSA